MKTTKTLTKWLVGAVVLLLLAPGLSQAHGYDYDVGIIQVMTRNMYIGADIFRIAEAQTPEEVPVIAAQVFATMLQSNPAERIDAMAAEIDRTRPHLIGLQEAMLIRTQSPSDAIGGGTTPAETVLFDFVGMLEASLAARGLDYRVAAVLENVDVELPIVVGVVGGVPQFIDVRVTDRIAVLARRGVDTANVFTKHFEVTATLPLAGLSLDYLRGFISLDAWVHGKKYSFIDTHLEVDLPGPGLAVQAYQAQELLAYADTLPTPVVVTGDFNSGPQQPLVVDGIVSPYAQFVNAGLLDAWARREHRNPGYTCCQDELLRNETSLLDRRIDFVWLARGGRPALALARRVGASPLERTASGLWPSDHAGVVSRMYVLFPD